MAESPGDEKPPGDAKRPGNTKTLGDTPDPGGLEKQVRDGRIDGNRAGGLDYGVGGAASGRTTEPGAGLGTTADSVPGSTVPAGKAGTEKARRD
ncbi:hypothetical protein [Rhodocista pekingensis]|uniref:Uncharacterized protein n=1 Tax=Rhodocista pekingensis TaxID=201185 RepID=A0ABW2KXB5_9PROT